MSRFACLFFFAVLCLSCSQPLSKAPSWLGTYVGGSLLDDCDAVATDRAGDVYLACHVVSVDLPGVTGAVPIPGDPMNAYVVKVTAQLDAVEWGVLLAGSQYDGAFDIAVDARGHVFVAGLTGSVDFPVTANALQTSYGGGEADAFFAEIDPEGKLLEVSLGGGGRYRPSFRPRSPGRDTMAGGRNVVIRLSRGDGPNRRNLCGCKRLRCAALAGARNAHSLHDHRWSRV